MFHQPSAYASLEFSTMTRWKLNRACTQNKVLNTCLDSVLDIPLLFLNVLFFFLRLLKLGFARAQCQLESISYYPRVLHLHQQTIFNTCNTGFNLPLLFRLNWMCSCTTSWAFITNKACSSVFSSLSNSAIRHVISASTSSGVSVSNRS